MDIWEDIKRYQDTLSYASSKVDYSVGENIYMLPSDMNLKIRLGTVRYNNKILVSNEKFSLGKNVGVNAPARKSHQVTQTADSNCMLGPRTPLVKVPMEPHFAEAHSVACRAHTPNISHKNQEPLGLIL